MLEPHGLSPYQELLGDAFDTLHPNVRAAHRVPLRANGVFDVTHGSHPLTTILVRLMKLPAAGDGVPVDLHAVPGPTPSGASSPSIVWNRRIGRSTLETCQFARRGFLVERSGPGRLIFSLRAADGDLIYERASSTLLHLPLPSALSPQVRARVSPDQHGWHVEVVVEWRGHLVCRYRGSMRHARTPA